MKIRETREDAAAVMETIKNGGDMRPHIMRWAKAVRRQNEAIDKIPEHSPLHVLAEKESCENMLELLYLTGVPAEAVADAITHYLLTGELKKSGKLPEKGRRECHEIG